MAQPDAETAQSLTEADKVLPTLESGGWRVIKAKLDEKILDLQNINNLDFTSEQTVLFDLKARKMAADLLYEWLKNDVYGFVEQQSIASEAMRDPVEQGFIERH